jgi:hypothetical protein
MNDYTGYTVPTIVPPQEARRRPTSLIVLAVVTAILVITAGVLTISLVKTSTRANHAESVASSRAKEISLLKTDIEGQKARADQAEAKVSSLTTRATDAERTLDQWRNAGAADAAFFNTVDQQAPSISLAGRDLTVQLGHAVCTAEGRGASRDEVINANSYFPLGDVQQMVAAAELFLC